jgi:excisionase family DNA binding protein
MSHEIIRVTTAADILGVSEHSVRRWADTGFIRCMRTLGNHRLFDRAEIERVKEKLKRKGKPHGET